MTVVPVAGATGGRPAIVARSAASASAGIRPVVALMRRLAIAASHADSWALISAVEAKARPGRNEVSR